MITAPKALISGEIPKRTLEKTTIGRVVVPGPETKLAITTSSSDKVKAKSQPASKAGVMIGIVMTKKAFSGRQPRSIAASSRERSNCSSLAFTIIATYAIENVTCEIRIVSNPRPDGQPKRLSNEIKVSNRARPVIISGITNGAVNRVEKRVKPLNALRRERATAAIVPKKTEHVADVAAILSERKAAEISSELVNSFSYHLKLKPPQTDMSRELLKEYKIVNKIGR